MWEVATLGNIPTSTYFVTCVAFFWEGRVAPSGAFLSHSPHAPLRYPPQQLEPLDTARLRRFRQA